MNEFLNNISTDFSKSFKKIETIDMHTGGEPLRIITRGLPSIHGATVLEKRRYFKEHSPFFSYIC